MVGSAGFEVFMLAGSPLFVAARALAALAAGSAGAAAKICSDIMIEGRGEQSRYVWLAKTKARANWRYRVRGNPKLGAAYANWARADNTEERCLTGPLGTICIFTGTPCLP